MAPTYPQVDALYKGAHSPEEHITRLIDRIEATLAEEQATYSWGPTGKKWLIARGAGDNPNGQHTLNLYKEHLQLLDELLELLNEHHKELSNVLHF